MAPGLAFVFPFISGAFGSAAAPPLPPVLLLPPALLVPPVLVPLPPVLT